MSDARPARRKVLAYLAAAAAGATVAGLPRPRAAAASTWDETRMIDILEHPDTADHAAYAAVDSAGNAMQSPSVIQLDGTAYRYAAVYHTPYAVTGGYRFTVNLAVSDDLTAWAFVRTLVDNADMPKVLRVTGASWIVVAHEQWSGPGPASTAPSRVAF